MKSKHRGLLAIAAVAALSLTACAGGVEEPAAAAPNGTSSATATAASPAQSASPSATGTPEFLAGAQSPGVGIEDYLLGSWWCKTTGEYDAQFLGMNSNSTLSLPEEIIFRGDGRWAEPEVPKLREWEYLDSALYIEYDEGVYFDLPPMIQIPSTLTVTSHTVDEDSNQGPENEATTEVSFEIDKMTMKTAEYTDPARDSALTDRGETITCRK